NVAVYVRKAGSAPEDPKLAALPSQVKAMVKQQLAEIEQVTDKGELEEILTDLRTMAGKAPPQMKPAIEYLIERAEQRLDSLPAAPQPGGEAQKTPPGAKPKA
ncbi:MAG: hypothetical protein MUO25_11105, partial [Thermoanaerobaculaceae bacterium]|nr:hypothetical protein [Thermoanaerobaculaceae bacterium]